MIYRVALWVDQSSIWKWKSTILSCPGALFNVLKIYDSVATTRVRVFFASSDALMDAMLVRENYGLVSNSVTLAEFLQSRKRIPVEAIQHLELELSLQVPRTLVTQTVKSGQLDDRHSSLHAGIPVEPSTSGISSTPRGPQEAVSYQPWQEEPERSSSGDCDSPYTFTLPTSMRQALAWTRLLAKVHRGELEP